MKNLNKAVVMLVVVIAVPLLIVSILGNPFKDAYNVAAVAGTGQVGNVLMLNVEEHEACVAIGGAVVQKGLLQDYYCELEGPITSIPNPAINECDRVSGLLTTDKKGVQKCHAQGRLSVQILGKGGDCPASGGFAYVAKDRRGNIQGDACAFPGDFYVIPITPYQLSACTDTNGFYGTLKSKNSDQTIYCALGEPYSNFDPNVAVIGNCEGLPGTYVKDALAEKAHDQGCIILQPTIVAPVVQDDCKAAGGFGLPDSDECYMIGNFVYEQDVPRDSCFEYSGVPMQQASPEDPPYCFIPSTT
ncbi:MAG: hypothetical protein Q8R36_04310 [bacterium]|nr:hypothetical protein [bacterium]